MGVVHPGIPKDLALALRDKFALRCFVETGTYRGATTTWSAGEFEQVITVEASTELYKETSKELQHLSNVIFHNKSSVALLREIIDDLPRTLFWLDAHWSDGNTAGKDQECPLIQELAIIAPSLQNHIVLIDDARFFLQPAPTGHKYTNWPSLDDIFRVMQSLNQTFTCVIDDCIVIAPATYRIEISNSIFAGRN